jgi:PTS system beta-glucosides-specific IIC component
VRYISGSFKPLLPSLIGAGILRSFAVMIETMHWLNPEGTELRLLWALGNAPFYFMPILLAYGAATTLGATPFLAVTLVASLITPDFASLMTGTDNLTFFDLPFHPLEYGSTVVPTFIIVAIFAPTERFLKRVIHPSLSPVLSPLLCLLILGPLLFMVVGPLGNHLSNSTGQAVAWLINNHPFLAGAFLGGSWVILVTMGLHWGVIIPLTFIQMIHYGYATLPPIIYCSTYAQIGVSIGVLLRANDKSYRKLMAPSIGVAILTGVTDPLMQGIILRHKQAVLPIIIIMGGLAGAFTAHFYVQAMPVGTGGLFSIPGLFYNSPKKLTAFLILNLLTIIGSALLVMRRRYD